MAEVEKSAYEKLASGGISASQIVAPSIEWAESPLDRWVTTAERLQERLKVEANVHVNIDEVSLLFRNDRLVWRWIENFVRNDPDVKLFNVADDNVRTRPIESGYDVRYWFLETNSPLRVEMMGLGDGFSPLHSALRANIRADDLYPLVVHYSFKCFTVDDYGAILGKLRAATYEDVMHCESNYGRFSYWQAGPHTDKFPAYVKPRVNTRDIYVPKGAERV